MVATAWKQQGFHTGYHYLENTAYVRQSCGAPSKHRLYVHGDGYEISGSAGTPRGGDSGAAGA